MENKYFYAYMRLKKKWEREHEAPPLDLWDDAELLERLYDVITLSKAPTGKRYRNDFERIRQYVFYVLDEIYGIKNVWGDDDPQQTLVLALIEACFQSVDTMMDKIEKGR
jgi:hypothetical protein